MSDIKIVYFTAAWCMPCQSFGPTLFEVAGEKGVTVEKRSISKDEGMADGEQESNMEMAKSFGIRSIPTILAMRNGDVVKTNTGVLSQEQLLEWFKGL